MMRIHLIVVASLTFLSGCSSQETVQSTEIDDGSMDSAETESGEMIASAAAADEDGLGTPAAGNAPAPTTADPPAPAATDVPAPTTTDVPAPATTDVPEPATTDVPEPTTTDVPEPATTDPPAPATTDVPAPTTTDVPAPTTTDVPAPATTDVPAPATTDVPAPTTTDVPAPTTTDVPAPATTDVPEPTTTDVPEPTTTDVPAPATTDPPAPTPNQIPNPRFDVEFVGEEIVISINGRRVAKEHMRRTDNAVEIIGTHGQVLQTIPIPQPKEHPPVMIGVRFETPGEALRKQLGSEVAEYSLVIAVMENGPGYLAGMEDFDLVTAVDGKTPANPAAIRARLNTLAPGDVITLTVRRGTNTKDITMQSRAWKHVPIPAQLQLPPVVPATSAKMPGTPNAPSDTNLRGRPAAAPQQTATP